MKTSIKTTIGIIVIGLSSITLAQAGEHRYSRDHDRSADRSQHRSYDHSRHQRSYNHSRHQRHYRHNKRRPHWKHYNHRLHSYRGHRHSHRRHYRKHHGYERHYRNHRRFSKRGYNHTTYVAPSHSSHGVIIKRSKHALPALAGSLIGSSIANDVSHGDPVATFGGAVFGAIVGNAIAHH